MEQASLEAAIAAMLARVVPGFSELLSARRLTGGASQETWCLVFQSGNGERRLCLRRNCGAVGEAGNITPTIEARLLTAASVAGVPEPEVLHVLTSRDQLGEGFLMEWLDGESLGGRITHSSRLAGIRPQLARQCGEILGRIHGIDIAAEGLAGSLEALSPAELVAATWAQYREFQSPQPMLDYTARWLLDNVPPGLEPTLVHGDFRNGNLMVCPDRGIVGVLDWELASIGDPVRDLGWACVNSWRFGKPEMTVGGFGSVDELLAGYQSVTGLYVSPEHLQFWIVFGSFWWSVVCLRMAASYRSGENSSLERPAIGRRASEGQADCVAMLLPGTGQSIEVAPAATTELPDLPELIGSVGAFLSSGQVDELTGANAYLARVAANSLAIAERQLRLAPTLEQEECKRLQHLLGSDGDLSGLRKALAGALGEGMPLDTPGLADHLRQTVMGQLSIDQPAYRVSGQPGYCAR